MTYRWDFSTIYNAKENASIENKEWKNSLARRRKLNKEMGKGVGAEAGQQVRTGQRVW
jgi:hypothetical protein